MTAKDTVRAAREMLEKVTPLKGDCGRVCGAACCRPDETGRGGMLLFPGEEALYALWPDWARLEEAGDFSVDGRAPKLLVCRGECPRAERPLACRLFPLTPVAREEGAGVDMDVRAWAVCPLMEHGRRGLNPAFVRAAEEAARLLWEEPACRRFLRALTAHLEAWRSF